MRVIVQRVMKASVTVGEELVSSIGKGLCVLVGISKDDTLKDMDYIVRKVLNLRVFEDEEGKRWTKSVMDKQYDVLCVSQFTLYAVMKGNKPDYHLSMGGDDSKAFYENFVQSMQKVYNPEKIKDGLFGAMMQVHIQNDGPVTITLESPANAGPDPKGRKQRSQAQKSGAKSDKKDSAALGNSAALANDVQDKLSLDDSNVQEKCS